MWNEFRDKNGEEEQSFFQDDTPAEEYTEEAAPVKKKGFDIKSLTREPILGMTPVQRFIIATMLLMTVCILGSMFMLVTEKFALF